MQSVSLGVLKCACKNIVEHIAEHNLESSQMETQPLQQEKEKLYVHINAETPEASYKNSKLYIIMLNSIQKGTNTQIQLQVTMK